MKTTLKSCFSFTIITSVFAWFVIITYHMQVARGENNILWAYTGISAHHTKTMIPIKIKNQLICNELSHSLLEMTKHKWKCFILSWSIHHIILNLSLIVHDVYTHTRKSQCFAVFDGSSNHREYQPTPDWALLIYLSCWLLTLIHLYSSFWLCHDILHISQGKMKP